MNRNETIVKKWFAEHSWDELEEGAAKELLKTLREAKEDKTSPYCHGVPMQKCERYLATGGYLVRVYRCMFCYRKEEVVE